MARRHQKLLAQEDIGKLLMRLSLPAMAGMIAQAFYNIIDTLFIGHAVGALGIAGLTIVFPIQIFMYAVMLPRHFNLRIPLRTRPGTRR